LDKARHACLHIVIGLHDAFDAGHRQWSVAKGIRMNGRVHHGTNLVSPEPRDEMYPGMLLLLLRLLLLLLLLRMFLVVSMAAVQLQRR
jgi:hypothetical protein